MPNCIRSKSQLMLTMLIVFAILFTTQAAWAQKSKGGKGGPKDEDPTPTRFRVLELPIPQAFYLTDQNSQGQVTIATDNGGEYAVIHASTGELVHSGMLPWPDFMEPNTRQLHSYGRGAVQAIRRNGIMVGFADVYDPELEPEFDPNRRRATVWKPSGEGTYDYWFLPGRAPEHQAKCQGLNDLGDIVGGSGGHAVIWSAPSYAAEDLNTDWTEQAGWELQQAMDINNSRQITGYGTLDGVRRGFLLDHVTRVIWPIPLIGAASGNWGSRINESGQITGDAWDGKGDPHGQNPDYVRGFLWDGPGTQPIVLEPLSDSSSMTTGMNDMGIACGNSWLKVDDPIDEFDQVPTLWERDAAGKLVATDLTTQIPSEKNAFLYRAWDVNNDGWVLAYGRTFSKGSYSWHARLLIPAD